jgi:GNAT superfamily N-acetyltransferase/RimJ/RimL family protein N-acetyltransferase
MPISIAPLADSQLDDAYRISRAAWEIDVPDIPFASRTVFGKRVRHSWPGTGHERYLALLDGVPAGYLGMRLPLDDNRHMAHLEVLTAPESRRRGVGRALIEQAVTRCRALGRTHLVAQTTDQRPDGDAFAGALGAKPGLADTRSRLDLPPADQGRLDALLAEAWTHAADYRLVQWTRVPPTELLDDVAYLESRLNLDAPTGDLPIEQEQVDAEKIVATEEYLELIGRTSTHTGVRHGARLVAWTTVSGNSDDPGQTWQQITIVDPAHRGHRLGLIVKLENLRYLRRLQPDLRAIDTFNATANDHMLAINDALGFRRVDQWMQWQLTV